MPAPQKAKVFKNGRSQAVRIPAEYRFTTDEVFIERDPRSGVLKLSEKPLRTSSAEDGRLDLVQFLQNLNWDGLDIEREPDLGRDIEL